ncbi:hypothetical protein AT1G64584 [Arabidopsis thaliana]|uniref:Uncharacterized protein n=1 Tax=Arabidopsis thaliana TaxID=3702 RepID=A0A1P8AWJ4_ARATH|nr:uncharacterized protein AT1G64584 [Arabidopsis thaliana]ANM60977.1 hypothetical protein AT1G64584 [Arabidopsis thaliana]|eukprot:NP_001323224.1 hypothetical protein AT1G64584 [Arabidopsis thaliana]
MEESGSNNGSVSVISRVKFDQVATWVVSAFFTSLERCACLNLSTTDLDDDDDAKYLPLVVSATPRPSEDIV